MITTYYFSPQGKFLPRNPNGGRRKRNTCRILDQRPKSADADPSCVAEWAEREREG